MIVVILFLTDNAFILETNVPYITLNLFFYLNFVLTKDNNTL